MSILVTFAFSEKGYDLFIPCRAFDPGSCFSYIFVKLQFSQSHCHFNEITRTCLKWYWIPIRQWELSREVEHSIMKHLRMTWKGCQNISKILLCAVNYNATIQLMAPFSSKWTGTALRATEFAQPALQNASLFLHKTQLFKWWFLNTMSLVKGIVLRISLS